MENNARHAVRRPRAGRDSATGSLPAYTAKLRTPFAVLGIRTVADTLTSIEYLPNTEGPQPPSDPLSEKVWRQLEQYFVDPGYKFKLPLAPRGTDFQRRVWRVLESIPVGGSHSYGELARMLGTAPRAVGGACRANPIALVIPCHRVVGSRGALGGFMGTASGDPISIKRWLLTHEGYRFGA